MVWIKNYFPYAGFIRIPIGEIYHYAIYVSDEEIIQFGEPPSSSNKIPDKDIRVCVTTLNSLLRISEYVEGAKFDENEFKNRLAPDETVSRARSLIGSGGYSFIFNNCEHFAYLCVFGKPYSSQTEALRDKFLNITVVDAYIAKIPENVEFAPIYPTERYLEICNTQNQRVKIERYYAWKLLKIAIERSLGYDFNSLIFQKTDNGKWICDRCYFSITHSSGVVSVAVSKKPIGIDIEKVVELSNKNLPERILSAKEYNIFSSLSDCEANDYFIKKWTNKEAYFKYSSDKVFSPKKIIVDNDLLFEARLKYEDDIFYLSVVNRDIDRLRLFKEIKL